MARSETATVTLSQIAALAGVQPSAVSNWRRRFEDFPPPTATAVGGRDLYRLDQVEAWLLEHERFDPGRKSEMLLFEAANVLRGQTPADEGMAVLAAAVALSEFCDRFGIASHEDVRDRVAEIERDSPGLVGVFDLLTKLDRSQARQLMELTDAIDESRRVDVFEWVLAQRRRFVETRTSEEITDLLVALVGDAKTILDPAAGEAGVLTAIALASEDKIALELYGQEINEAAWRIGVQRLFLHLVFGDVKHADSLRDDQYADFLADAVICDPPYAMTNPLREVSRPPAWANFNVTSARTADFAWLEYAVHHLAPEGRGYVVLPAGTLWRKGRERELRNDLLRRGAIEAVIALPPGAGERTAIPLAVWILRPPQSTTDAPVLIIDSAGQGDAASSRLREQVERIAQTLNTWRTGQTIDSSARGFAEVVPTVELLAADADLTPSRWVNPQGRVSPDDQRRAIRASIKRLNAAHGALSATAVDLADLDPSVFSEWVSVRQLLAENVAEVVRGIRIAPDEFTQNGLRVLRTRDIQERGISDADPCYIAPGANTAKVTLTEPGDIIVSPASGRLRAAVDLVGGRVLASPLQGLRLSEDWLDPSVAAAFLASPRNRRFATGLKWGYARVDLRDLELPRVAPQEARRLSETVSQLALLDRQIAELAASSAAARDAILGSFAEVEAKDGADG